MHAQLLSHVQFFVTPWAVAYQSHLSIGFPRQEHGNGLPFPSPGDLPHPGIKPGSLALASRVFTTEPPGKPILKHSMCLLYHMRSKAFLGGSSGKEPTWNSGDIRDVGSIPVSESSPGRGHCNPLQYSCLENSMDRGAWQATYSRIAESDKTEATSHTHMK